MIRSVFLGTPQASVLPLQTLAGLTTVSLVVTQPDRPRGRSGRPAPSPVKEAADELHLPVAQPADGRELLDALAGAAPFDIGLVVAYGMILRADVLEIPRRGFLNLHYSLLPRWRGAAPVQRAILAGDERTGVTLMQVDEGLDTGPILAAQSIAIDEGDDAAGLLDRLNTIAVRLLRDRLTDHVAGRALPVPQPTHGATYARKIRPEEARLDLSRTGTEVLRSIRGFSPRPGSFAYLEGERFKIWEAQTLPGVRLEPGRLALVDGELAVGVGDGAIRINSVQAAGSRRMDALDWARGRRGDLGALE